MLSFAHRLLTVASQEFGTITILTVTEITAVTGVLHSLGAEKPPNLVGNPSRKDFT